MGPVHVVSPYKYITLPPPPPLLLFTSMARTVARQHAEALLQSRRRDLPTKKRRSYAWESKIGQLLHRLHRLGASRPVPIASRIAHCSKCDLSQPKTHSQNRATAWPSVPQPLDTWREDEAFSTEPGEAFLLDGRGDVAEPGWEPYYFRPPLHVTGRRSIQQSDAGGERLSRCKELFLLFLFFPFVSLFPSLPRALIEMSRSCSLREHTRRRGMKDKDDGDSATGNSISPSSLCSSFSHQCIILLGVERGKNEEKRRHQGPWGSSWQAVSGSPQPW